jgi:glyoxylase-like metal-dependent hydrolase (beta-lactamase superfamily II)
MVQGLYELGAQMETTDLFITHLHADHSGLTSFLATPETTIMMSENDGLLVSQSRVRSHWGKLSSFLVISGLIASGVEDHVENHPGFNNSCENFDNFTTVNEGYEIKVGRYSFRCIETKGHTSGHVCLYEPEKKL